MNRITRADLEGVVALINKLTGDRHDFDLGRAYGGYRLERNGGSADVSPRMASRAMYFWLHAYKDGLLLILTDQTKESKEN